MHDTKSRAGKTAFSDLGRGWFILLMDQNTNNWVVFIFKHLSSYGLYIHIHYSNLKFAHFSRLVGAAAGLDVAEATETWFILY